jgi:hypothetical protein
MNFSNTQNVNHYPLRLTTITARSSANNDDDCLDGVRNEIKMNNYASHIIPALQMFPASVQFIILSLVARQQSGSEAITSATKRPNLLDFF